MPEHYVGISDDASHKLMIRADGSIATTANVPEGAAFYIYSIKDTPGVLASNNFLSVFNPADSDKTVVFFQAIVSSYAIAAASSPNSMAVYRTTAASGGTQVAAADVPRFATTYANPKAEVRFGNPTTTDVGGVLIAFPPPIATGAGTGSAGSIANPPGASFVCTPGQGIVWNTAAGDTDQVWNLNTVWAEF